MAHRQLLPGALLLLIGFAVPRLAAAQAGSHVLDESVSYDRISRAQDGGFTAIRVAAGGTLVARLTGDLQPLWAKTLTFAGDPAPSSTRALALPDGGAAVVALIGSTVIMGPNQFTSTDDTLVSHLGLARITPGGGLAWARDYRIRGELDFASAYTPHVVEADAEGELLVHLWREGPDDRHYALKVGADGAFHWLTQVTALGSEMALLPADGAADDYIAAAPWFSSGPLSVARIGASGASAWVRQANYGTLAAWDPRMRLAADGRIFVAGSRLTNVAVYRFQPDGAFEGLRLCATSPPITGGFSGEVRGFEPHGDGFVLLTNGVNPTRTIVAPLGSDGAPLPGHRTLSHTQGPLLYQPSFTALSLVDGMITLGGTFMSQNTAFGLTAYRPLVATMPLAEPADCLMAPEAMVSMAVPAAEIQVTDGPALVPEPPPMVLEATVTLTDASPPTPSPMCTIVGMEEPVAGPHALRIAPNPVARGEALAVAAQQAVALEVRDGLGRLVAGSPTPSVQHALAVGHLAPGCYTVRALRPDGSPAAAQRIVVP